MFFPVLLLKKLYQKKKFILLTILIIILLRNMNTRSETETFLNYGDYPQTVDQPLLGDIYPVKKQPGLSIEGREILHKLYPIYEDWSSPDNGNCSPAELCNSIYDNIQVKESSEIKSPSNEWSNTRINFY
jgi:hypothetical protein